MAKTHSGQNNSTKQRVIIVFVVVCVSLLAIQIGANVQDVLNQGRSPDTQVERAVPATLTPAGPTPTIDFSVPIAETDF